MSGELASEIRRGRSEDHRALCDLWRQVDRLHAEIRPDFFACGQDPARTRRYVSAIVDDPDQELLVADTGAQLLGLIHLQLYDTPTSALFVDRRRAHVEDLVVDREHRRRGVGRALLGAGEHWARQQEADQLVLTVWMGNGPGLEFYGAQQYRTVNQVLAKELSGAGGGEAAVTDLGGAVRHTHLRVNGVRLHVAEAGPTDGRPVFLLHGFPECWYGWRHQLMSLAEAGFRVIAPDQRGYNTSGKPAGIAQYTRDVLARDVLGLMDHYGVQQGTVVGHDWGGAVAWWLACQHPERVAQLATLNLPHPIVFTRALKSTRQALRSWYMALFQLPWIPEWWLGRDRAAALCGVLRDSTCPGAVTAQDLEVYRRAYLQPGALTGMLSWYRAARLGSRRLAHPQVQMPTCLIWGKRDAALGWEMAAPSMQYCADGRLFLLEDAGHFVQLDEPRRVSELLLDFFGAA